MQNKLLETIFLTGHDVGELAPVTVIPFAATSIENPASPVDEDHEGELLSILLQSPPASTPTPSLDWLEACMIAGSVGDVTSEHTALPLVHGQRSAKTRSRADFIDFTKDHNLKVRLEELQGKEDRTDEESKEMDDLAAILGCQGMLRSHKKRRHKTTELRGRGAGRVKLE
jgi:hypothetical protein